jgi:predicted Zn finger-like uncharacterized protein
MADAFLRVVCPSCGASGRVPAALAGRTVRCTKCATRFPVPLPAPRPPEPEAAPPTVLEEPKIAAPPATVLENEAPLPTVPERSAEPTALEAPAAGAAAPTVLEKPPGAVAWEPGDVVLGLYEVLGVLGEGGMGRVYRVRHRGWGLDLAVKAPLPSVLEAAGGADLFEREAETWVNLGLHPHVVTCHYVRRLGGLPLVFAELVDGGSLHEGIHTGRVDSAENILDVAVQFAWGLHHAHQQGLVHRDVKPANVMLAADGVAKVTDFGLARARPARLALRAGAAAGHTMTVDGGGGGTPAYASPEQVRGEAMSRRSDLWSFALCVLEMFLGRRSWSLGIAAPEVLRSYRGDGLAADGRPPMPPEVADLLERSFSESPDERPHDLAEAAAVLRSSWERLSGRAYLRSEPRGGAASADALNNRAVSLVDLGRAAEATALWKRALAAEPHHPEATYNGVLAAWTEGAVADPEAVRRMEEACASHASARAQQLKARVHLALGQGAEAAAALARATALGGTDDLARDVEATARPAPAPRRTLRGLPGPVAALAVTPDGRTVAAGSGAEVRLWDAGSGQVLRVLAIEGGPVRSLLVLPGGRFLVVGAEQAPLALWDVASGRPVRTFERVVGFATSLALTPGAPIVVAGGSDRTLRLYDAATGRCLREIVGHDDAVTAVAAGPTRLASAARDGTVRLWSREDGRELARLAPPGGRPLALVLDEAQARVVAAGDDGVVRDWGVHSHELVRTFASHAQAVHALALSPDGSLLLSGSGDRTVRVFEADGQRLLAKAHLDAGVQALAVAPDGTVWAAHGTAVSAVQPEPLDLPAPALCRPSSASEEEARDGLFAQQLAEARRSYSAGDVETAFRLARTARTVPGRERAATALALWDELSLRLPRRGLTAAWEEGTIASGSETVLAVALAPDGRQALSAAFDGTVTHLDVERRATLAAFAGHDGAATSVAFAGPSTAVSGGRDRTVRVYDLAARKATAVLEGHGETVASVDARTDGTRAVSGGVDGTVRLWDLRSRAPGRVIEGHGAPVSCVRFAPDGLVVASAGWDGTARLWDADSGAALGVLEGHEANVTALAVHPAGRQVATGAEDGTIRLFDPRRGRELRRLAGHQAAVTALAFTPDGRFLLSSGRDASVRAFDLRRGEEVRALPHPAPVLALALSSSASRLVSAGGDGSVRAWRLDWDLDPEGAAATPSTMLTPEAARARTVGPGPRPATLRDDLRRAAPAPVRAIPRAVGGAARSIPWRKIAIAGVLVAAVVGSILLTRKPKPRLRLSPYLAFSIPKEIDLIDVERFMPLCAASDYPRHLDRVASGNPDADDVGCVAAAGQPSVVADVLDRAPLDDADPMAARRLRRNAASALAPLRGDAAAAVCARLGDDREAVRSVAAMALSVNGDAAAVGCVRDALETGTGAGRAAAARAFRQQVARRFVDVAAAWGTVQTLLRSPDPQARREGLGLVSLFSAAFARPAAEALEQDPDPEVAAAARRTVSEVDGIRKADLLQGDVEP